MLRKSALTCCKAEFAFLFLFFSIRVFFHKYSRFTGQQGNRKTICLYPFCLLHGHLDVSQDIAAVWAYS